MKQLRLATDPISVLLLASGDLWAGAEAVVYELAKGLTAHTDISVSVVSLNNGRLAELCEALGVQTYVLDEARYAFPTLVKRLSQITRQISPRPHIIHSHRYKENILAAAAAPLAGFPRLVTTLHGISEVKGGFKTCMITAINTQLMRRVFIRTIVVSDDIVRYLVSQVGVPLSRIGRIHNGIEVEEPTIYVSKPAGMITIGSAGRLVPVKDYALMVDIAAVVCAGRDDVRFILAGDGPGMSALRTKVHEMGLDRRFVLLGHVDDLGPFFSGLDIYLNTSQHEGIPMTILEAMSHSLPVVAPAVGGMPEIIEHGRNGYLISERSVGAFSRTLTELIAGEDIRRELGDNARRRVQEAFSTRAMTQAYQAVYREILKAEREGI